MTTKLTVQEDIKRIVTFIQEKTRAAGAHHVVIAWSGGIDSTVSLYLCAQALGTENVTVLHLPYETSYQNDFREIQSNLGMSSDRFHVVSIKSMVDSVSTVLKPDDLRKGNMMARMRMIVIYDYAKKLNALVCGTENRTEDLLGYFTRFGDQASDFEPIQHLYKTQVYEYAKALQVPQTFIDRAPSAGLWAGQTDEGEFGFTYAEADAVLSRMFDESMSIEHIEKEYPNARTIVALVKKNEFKHKVPYSL
jgi:NAD+ synthase